MNSKRPFNNITINNSKSGEIYFVSDLEGCYAVIRESKQSRLQCSDVFFNKLEEHLQNNPRNKVAFLGDYFEGPEFLLSIIKIVNLHKKYGERVYIILGNRDVNKLRLLFELDELTVSSSTSNNTNSQNYWGVWKGFYPKYLKLLMEKQNSKQNSKEKTELEQELFKIILDESMGTVPDYKKISSHYKIMFNIFKNFKKFKKNQKSNLSNLTKSINNISKNEILSDNLRNTLLKNVTTNNVNNILKGNVKNSIAKQIINIFETYNITNNTNLNSNPIMYLFNHGSLVSYDKYYKVLMSHGGGIDAIPTEKYYNSFESQISVENKNATIYFKNIELARKELMKIPSYNNSNKPENIDELVRIGNLPLRSFMTHPDINNPYYYILQASGLKPDRGKHFVSFIHSCDLNEGFGGPKSHVNGNIPTTNLKYLKKIGVDFISFGHINYSLEIPLIYSRTLNMNNSIQKIVFIANDISNYRPFGKNIPISYIQRPSVNNLTKYKAGVKRIVDDKNIIVNNNKNSKRLNNKYNEFMGPFDYNNVPTFTNSQIKVGTSIVKFIGSFKPAIITT